MVTETPEEMMNYHTSENGERADDMVHPDKPIYPCADCIYEGKGLDEIPCSMCNRPRQDNFRPKDRKIGVLPKFLEIKRKEKTGGN